MPYKNSEKMKDYLRSWRLSHPQYDAERYANRKKTARKPKEQPLATEAAIPAPKPPKTPTTRPQPQLTPGLTYEELVAWRDRMTTKPKSI